jgi:(2Fe-2S) ferredoxin
MEPFRYHVFICTQQKPEGTPCCSAGGSAKLLEVLQSELQRQGLFNDVQVTSCGCLGLCDGGPDMITYPDGIWYAGLKVEHIAEIVHSHFLDGRPIARLQRRDLATMKTEILDHRDRYLASLKAKKAAQKASSAVEQPVGV